MFLRRSDGARGVSAPTISKGRSGLDAHERRQRPEEAAEVGVVGLRRLGLRLGRRALERLGPLPREGLLRGLVLLCLLLVARRAPRRALLGARLLLVLAAREGGRVRFLLLALTVAFLKIAPINGGEGHVSLGRALLGDLPRLRLGELVLGQSSRLFILGRLLLAVGVVLLVVGFEGHGFFFFVWLGEVVARPRVAGGAY